MELRVARSPETTRFRELLLASLRLFRGQRFSLGSTNVQLVPQRGCVFQPRVGPSAGLPWVGVAKVGLPQRGYGRSGSQSDLSLAQPCWGRICVLPKVAAARQPWALGRNPVGA